MNSVKTMNEKQFKEHKREGDGICILCFEWSFGKAEPLSEHVYCQNCDNRSTVGIEKAKQLGLVKIEND